jgi:hypothetical protein
MSTSPIHRSALAGALGALFLAGTALAQPTQDTKPQPGKDDAPRQDTAAKPGHADHPAPGAASARADAKMTAVLVEPEKKAKEKAATVKVTATGVKIVDPAASGEKAVPGEAHLHYTVDDAPTVATTSTKLSFHGLKPGKHTIKVVLAGNDHSPLGPEETLSVTIP